jgi:hypothetical protein
MRRRVSIEVDGTISVVRGWLAHKLTIEAGLRPTFSGVRSGWVFDTKKLPDLLAHLERRRFVVDITDLEIVPSSSGSPGDQLHDQNADDTSMPDAPLFELDGGR